MLGSEEIQKALQAATNVIAHYEALPLSPFKRTAKPGHRRGIDVYERDALVKVVSFLLVRHRHLYGDELNLINPRSFTEKINWSKLFREMKVPESGNKLLTSRFIPPSLQGRLCCPEIVWHSPTGRLPTSDQVNPGTYYLKANHGSGMLKRIQYPLDIEKLFYLERMAASWLNTPFGLRSGEWFYNIFQKKLLLEKAVSSISDAISCKFYVFNNEVKMIAAQQKVGEEVRSKWFNPDFEPYYVQSIRKRAIGVSLSKKTKADILLFAEQVSRDIGTVRIDFLVNEEEEVLLNEVTFTSKDGLRAIDRDFDFSFGDYWKGDFTFET